VYIYTHTYIYTSYKNTDILYKINYNIGPEDVLPITWNNERRWQFIFSCRIKVFNKITFCTLFIG